MNKKINIEIEMEKTIEVGLEIILNSIIEDLIEQLSTDDNIIYVEDIKDEIMFQVKAVTSSKYGFTYKVVLGKNEKIELYDRLRNDILTFMQLLQKNYSIVPKLLNDQTIVEREEFEELTTRLLKVGK